MLHFSRSYLFWPDPISRNFCKKQVVGNFLNSARWNIISTQKIDSLPSRMALFSFSLLTWDRQLIRTTGLGSLNTSTNNPVYRKDHTWESQTLSSWIYEFLFLFKPFVLIRITNCGHCYTVCSRNELPQLCNLSSSSYTSFLLRQ